MNANQIINMIVRMVMRQVLGRGINAGMDMATRKMSRKSDDPEAEARQGGDSREMASRAKQAMKVTRRVGKF